LPGVQLEIGTSVNTQHNSTYLERHPTVGEWPRNISIDGRPRFAVLRIKLPVFENADSHGQRKPQPEYKFERTEKEIRKEFDGYDFHGTPFTGHCKNEEGEWEDDLNVLIEIDGEFDDARLGRLRIMKRRLKRRFKQWEIYMAFAPIIRL
jgi:hypothetical protein